MGRLLVFAVVIFALIWLLKRALGEHEDGDAPRARTRSLGASGDAGELVRCAHCGIHLPRSEAQAAGGRLYCGAEHARLGPGGG
jgi:uncharacterized protein